MNDGGPAFPASEDVETDSGYRNDVIQKGMTLLDWFAGQAIASSAEDVMGREGAHVYCEKLASCAYKVAIAMLAERKKLNDYKDIA